MRENVKKWICPAAVWAALSVCLYLFFGLLWNLSGGSLVFGWKRFLAIAAVAAMAVAFHVRAAQKVSGSYVKYLLAGETRKAGRVVYMDYLRVLATVLVIALHSVQALYDSLPPGPGRKAHGMVSALCMVCNPLFIMLSGALILNGKEESLAVFYKKRVLRVLLPMAAYYVFLCFIVRGTGIFLPSNWLSIFREFAGNAFDFTPHFWLAFVILFFYISAPFFRVMVKNMDDALKIRMAAVILIAHGVFLYLPMAGIHLAAGTWLSGWESVFILGYFCATLPLEKYGRWAEAGAAASLAYMAYAVAAYEDPGALIYNNAPPMLLLTCGIFVFFRKHGDKWFSRIPAVLSVAAKYSFSVLLIHWFVLHTIVHQALGVNRAVLLIPLTLLFSLVFAVVYDNVFVFCLDRIVVWLLELPGRIRHRSGGDPGK